MQQFKVKLSSERVATELVLFHHNSGGWRLLPKLEGQQAEAGRIYTLTDDWDSDSAPAEIILKPVSDSETEVTLRPNSSEVWGVRLDAPLFRLGRNTYLGGGVSPPCAQFLTDFEVYIRQVATEQQESDTRPAATWLSNLNQPMREIVELWLKGFTAAEIGQKLGYEAKTILNRISDLRKAHGEEKIPRRRG